VLIVILAGSGIVTFAAGDLCMVVVSDRRCTKVSMEEVLASDRCVVMELMSMRRGVIDSRWSRPVTQVYTWLHLQGTDVELASSGIASNCGQGSSYCTVQ